jgi:hypothetical protein
VSAMQRYAASSRGAVRGDGTETGERAEGGNSNCNRCAMGMMKHQYKISGGATRRETTATIWATIWADEAIRIVYDLLPDLFPSLRFVMTASAAAASLV